MIQRPNRFAVWADLDGQRIYAHVPNSGRMHELLYPGAPIYLRETLGETRKTTHQVTLARQGQVWVSVDSRLAPTLMVEYLRINSEPLGKILTIRTEVKHGESRFDLQIHTDQGVWMMETKSVTLCRDGLGLFPDAPTTRGTRHLRELAIIAREGGLAAVAFVAQRDDVYSVAPNVDTDPNFAAALNEAAVAGVKLLAITCDVTLRTVTPVTLIPVQLPVLQSTVSSAL